MLASDVPKETQAILLAPTTTNWVDDLRHMLATAGYDIHTVSSSADVQRLMATQGVAALIADDAPDAPQLFEAAQRENQAKPLLIMVTQTPEALSADDYATIDLVLPPNVAYIQRQLQTFLRLRAQFNEAQQELTKKNREIQAVQLLKNALVHNLGHEFNTPMLQVKGGLSLLKEDVPKSGERALNLALQAAGRLEVLINNMTMLGSILEHNPGPIILRDTLNYAHRNLERQWQNQDTAKRVTIKIDEAEAPLPPVFADKQGLSKVLQLLMENALKFSQEAVLVTAKRVGDVVRITVSDQGIGISQEHLTYIFEPFYQVDSDITRRYPGAGIGLAIVKRILDQHGAPVQVTSTLGQGSSFAFDLPVIEIKRQR